MTAHVRERQADAVRGLIDRDRVGPGRPVRAELGERSVPLLEHGGDSTQSLTRTGRAPA